jgi:threonylcarbamoyladenosine tRNA methylthiotransferase MtaB
VRQAELIAASGVQEIVLTGVNIGDYGLAKDDAGEKARFSNFFELIQALDSVEGIERFRISSIEPNLLSDEIIDFVATSKRFVPHFHIPLQSGSDELLGKMRRRYKREVFAARLANIKEVMPNCCIGVDVIVGFPGETEAHFVDTYQFLTDVAPSYLHVFTYSERANTHALMLPGKVSGADKADRSTRLHILSDKLKRAFYTQNLGQSHTILWEGGTADEGMAGFTENYIKVQATYNPEKVGELETITLGHFNPESITYSLAQEAQATFFTELEVLH